jgi:hypothetical protein
MRRRVSISVRPRSWQATFCFPDDPHKSLVGEQGDLMATVAEKASAIFRNWCYFRSPA